MLVSLRASRCACKKSSPRRFSRSTNVAVLHGRTVTCVPLLRRTPAAAGGALTLGRLSQLAFRRGALSPARQRDTVQAGHASSLSDDTDFATSRQQTASAAAVVARRAGTGC